MEQKKITKTYNDMIDEVYGQNCDTRQEQGINLDQLVFRKNVDLQLFSELQQLYKSTPTTKSFINICLSSYFKQGVLRKLLPWIMQWKHQINLNLDSKKIPTILQQISFINFPNLKVIQFGFNCIVNIESIYFLNAPHLSSLYLYNNFIRSVRSLHKTKFTNLVKLSLKNNKLLELQRFQNIKWYKGRLEWLSVEDVNVDTISYDHIKILKIGQQIDYIWLNSPDRIMNNANKMFINKFQKFSLHFQSTISQ